MDDYGPQHWEKLYREGRTPWDAGGAPEELERYIREVAPTGRVLVPGCGSAYEAARLAEAGCDVLAVDFSPAAVGRATRLSAHPGLTIREADFFLLEERGFDCIYERAFLCALPPAMRSRWADRCAELLRRGGCLVGLFFIDPTATDGPPFGIGRAELESLLQPAFEPCMDRAAAGSLPVFSGRERWQAWRRR